MIENKVDRKDEEDSFKHEINTFLMKVEIFIEDILKNTEADGQDHLKHIKIYLSLKEYATINREAIRKICKKFDKKLTTAPYLQNQVIARMAKMELGSSKTINERLAVTALEEQKMFEKDNFSIL